MNFTIFYNFLIDFSEVGELDLGLARVQDISAEQLREMDPMNIAFVKLDKILVILTVTIWRVFQVQGTQSAILATKWLTAKANKLPWWHAGMSLLSKICQMIVFKIL